MSGCIKAHISARKTTRGRSAYEGRTFRTMMLLGTCLNQYDDHTITTAYYLITTSTHYYIHNDSFGSIATE